MLRIVRTAGNTTPIHRVGSQMQSYLINEMSRKGAVSRGKWMPGNSEYQFAFIWRTLNSRRFYFSLLKGGGRDSSNFNAIFDIKYFANETLRILRVVRRPTLHRLTLTLTEILKYLKYYESKTTATGKKCHHWRMSSGSSVFYNSITTSAERLNPLFSQCQWFKQAYL